MLHHDNLRHLLPGLTPFPSDVFTPAQPWLAGHLLPLISIDLGLVRPELAGNVATLVCPIEPDEGCLGDGTEAHHNAFSTTNWIAFTLGADNRLQFLGNEGYFQRAPQHAPVSEELREHAAEMIESHASARAFFQQHGYLPGYQDPEDSQPEAYAFLDQLGGPMWYGNWPTYTPLPAAFLFEDLAGFTQRGTLTFRNDSAHLPDDGIRITRDGKPFFMVASVAAYNWCAHGPDAIVMLYEPDSRTLLFTFDWS